tara:strand:+ start:5257 stop:5598 length:342 start_codon:yes stop_codon:yes gene_type:complete
LVKQTEHMSAASTPNKPRLITAFEKLEKAIQQQIKLEYPEGFSQHLISFTNKDGDRISALRYETEEKIYLVKMSKIIAEQLIEDDEDYDDDGNLTDDAREEYEDNIEDLEEED